MNDSTKTERLAADVAAEIRSQGHYQLGMAEPGGTCVVLAADDLGAHPDDIEALAVRVGVDSIQALWRWNDAHTTVEVLAALDSIAAASGVVAAAEAALVGVAS